MHPEITVAENLLFENRALLSPVISKRLHAAEAARLFLPDTVVSHRNASGALAEGGKQFLQLWKDALPANFPKCECELVLAADAAMFSKESARLICEREESVLPIPLALPASYFVAFVPNRLTEDAYLRFSSLFSGALPSRVESLRDAAENVFSGHAHAAIFPLQSQKGQLSPFLESVIDEFDLLISCFISLQNANGVDAFALLTKNCLPSKSKKKGISVRVSATDSVPLSVVLSVASQMHLTLESIRSNENIAWTNLSFSLQFSFSEIADAESFLVFLHQFSADSLLLGLYDIF